MEPPKIEWEIIESDKSDRIGLKAQIVLDTYTATFSNNDSGGILLIRQNPHDPSMVFILNIHNIREFINILESLCVEVVKYQS